MKRLGLALVALALTALVFAAPGWADSVTERIPGSFLGLMAWQWLGLVALLLVGLIVHEIVRIVAGKLLRWRERLTGTRAETGQHGIRRGSGLLGFVLPWYLFVDILELPLDFEHRTHLVVDALSILGVVLFVYGLWDAVCDAIAQRTGAVPNAQKLLIPVTRKLVRFLILFAGLILALGVFGVNITGLIAGVGIGGLVLALAAKDSVENVFGSLTILLDMPFALGDLVKIDKYEGTVEEINLRSTRIRTFEDSIITLPNSNLIKAAVENYGARRYRRQRFEIRVSYANHARNLERFMQAVREHLAKMPNVVHERTVVELNEMTEMSVGILVQCYFEATTFAEEAHLRSELMLAIFQAQERTGIVFVGAPIPPPEEKPRRISKELQRVVEEKEDII